MEQKILSSGQMATICQEMAAKGQRLVFTNGCFDLLHVGHVRYLQAAREQGDRLLVAVNGDASVRALKGANRPINLQEDRAEVLAALACVDFVTIFESERVTELVREIRPQVYVKGGDYTVETLDSGEVAALRQVGSEIKILQLVPGKSTTATIARMGEPGGGRLRIGILGSGKGSNFRALADAIGSGELEAEVSVVISDVAEAGILSLARERGYRAEYLEPGRFRTKLEPEAEARLVGLLQETRTDLVVLAGYMRMIKAPLLEAFPRRIINIHPSLLPQFPGLEAWAQALKAGVSETGCTVHYVDDGMDTGEILGQRSVPVLPGDTAASLHARIQVAEHSLYPEIVSRLVSELRSSESRH